MTAAQAIRDAQQARHALVDDVVLGCVTPVGEQGADIARTAVADAGLWRERLGCAVNRFCASGLEAVNMAAAKVMSGQRPWRSAAASSDEPRSDGLATAARGRSIRPWRCRRYFVPQGISADLIATKYGFSRDDVDAYAVESHKRAAKALGGRALREFRRAGDRPYSASPLLDQRRTDPAATPPCSRWPRSSRPSRCMGENAASMR